MNSIDLDFTIFTSFVELELCRYLPLVKLLSET
jgi:hypothetical protein